MSKPRFRFAPSPTGYLHVGGARTALYNWLLARKLDGTLILRIEDTDKERSSQEMVNGVIDGLKWLGLTWDEGPYFQSEYEPRHRAVAQQLLESGHAYRAFETKAELDQLRQQAEAAKQAFLYKGGPWRDATPEQIQAQLDADQPYAVRLKTPKTGSLVWHDQVYGELTVSWAEVDDFVILRSDGTPTYLLAAVVDDIDMRVSHIVRGADHIANTPKQLCLYRALGAAEPTYAHLPLILGKDRSRLSKRHGATSVLSYRDEGFLSWAFCNLLALVGWSPGGDQEIFGRNELIAAFSLTGVSRTNAVFDIDKARWLNGQHLHTGIHLENLAQVAQPFLAERGWWRDDLEGEQRQWFHGVLEMMRPRAKTITELLEMSRPYFSDELVYDDKAVRKNLKAEGTADFLPDLATAVAALDFQDAASMETALRAFAEARGLSAGKVFNAIRTAITGQSVSPGLFETLQAVGQMRSVARLQQAVALARS